MADKNLDDVLAERGSNYGDFNDHATTAQRIRKAIAKALKGNEYYQNALSDTEKAVLNEGLGMIAHKISRIANGNCRFDDSWTDIAGYASITRDRLQPKRENDGGL